MEGVADWRLGTCLQAFHDKFVESVRGAARALVMDVYGAREEGNSISASQVGRSSVKHDVLWLGLRERRKPLSICSATRGPSSNLSDISRHGAWSQGLVASMNDDGGVRLARYTGDVSSTIEDIQRQLFSLRTTCAGDSKEPTVVRIVFMGAGDITRASRGLLQALSGSSDGCAVHWAAAEVARDAFHA